MADYEPKKGWYSSLTQRIANKLPEWNAIRRRRDSVGQSLINAAAGSKIEHTWNEAERALRNKFIGTLEIDQPDLVARIDVPDSITLAQPTKIKNKVLNSSFEIWPNQSALPQLWRSSGDGDVAVVDDGFIGNRAAQLSAGYGESITVYQDIDIQIPANQSWTYSVWYSIDSSLALSSPASGFGLEAVGYCVDGTTETLRTAFDVNTGGRPLRIYVSGAFTKTTTKVRIQAVVSHTPTFTFTDSVIVDLFQMEIGTLPTSWLPNPLDNWPHIKVYSKVAPVLIESGDRTQFVESMEDFWIKAVPTRAAYNTVLTEDEVADSAPAAIGGFTSFGTAGRFTEIDFFDDEWPYTVEAYKLGSDYKLRMVGTDVPDILAIFDLGFRNYRDYFEVDAAVVFEAITYYNDWLWIVLKKADWAGTTKRWVCVADVRTPWPRPSYLEVMAVIELPTPSTSALITRVEFRYDDQQHLYIGDGHTTYVYDLYYDYFMISGRRIYMREDPTTITLVEAEPTRRELTAGKDQSSFDRTQGRR